MITSNIMLGLSREEVATVRRTLGREPNETEWAIIDAEWSEHSSYKSSKALLRLFPTSGDRVLLGPGYDAGVVDVGKGYAVTLHIESHNHPSAVDPYGGASTGIGGVIRDILSMGSRPLALVDILRFGDPRSSPHSKWLLRNVVRGIADYGNCVGVPTVAGDIEFDESFERNCLVDVACVGVARKDSLILGEARNPGDMIILAGGSTGRDGVGGAAFASKNLAKLPGSDRSSVQVPDPFMKKLLIDSLLEAAGTGLIRGMKDLGGGGLSTGLSEIAAKGGTGVEVELTRVRVREPDMAPTEIMTSESQERMLLILDPKRSAPVLNVLDKYEVPYAVIGSVTGDCALRLRWNGKKVVELPADLVANAPLVPRPVKRPLPPNSASVLTGKTPDVGASLMALLGSPNISSKRWVYEQYDHEVGTSTVLKPGMADAALMRLPNGSMLAVKADGNSKHSSLDPRRGAAGCVAEACRNIVAVGAEPIAMVDHLQFGDPSDPEVYWTFKESVEGMAEYCRRLSLPVVGGKVSFYNQDEASKRPIKPSPVAMVVGLAPPATRRVSSSFISGGDQVFLVGVTKPELGGSEYHESILRVSGGAVPKPHAAVDSRVYRAVLRLARKGLAGSIHDCSKGGLGVALAEMCIGSGIGVAVDLSGMAKRALTPAHALFSESHGRFVFSTRQAKQAESLLNASRLPYSRIGTTGGEHLVVSHAGKKVMRLNVRAMKEAWEGALPELMN
ncbi:MAG: phosphoribosylformylglycinamidine synthase subunit PurL [Nitrososphaerales archaeon]|nr:phosphoribosylformylglycinamidine synthase subunit PurL [Nitrososphaerales archaeon]